MPQACGKSRGGKKNRGLLLLFAPAREEGILADVVFIVWGIKTLQKRLKPKQTYLLPLSPCSILHQLPSGVYLMFYTRVFMVIVINLFTEVRPLTVSSALSLFVHLLIPKFFIPDVKNGNLNERRRVKTSGKIRAWGGELARARERSGYQALPEFTGSLS